MLLTLFSARFQIISDIFAKTKYNTQLLVADNHQNMLFTIVKK